MFPYDYSDFLQLHLNSDNTYDYDFDAHIAQCAHVFGPDEKGFSDGHHPPAPIVFSVSDGFGSSDSSSPSRSPSITKDTIKAESSDCEGTVPGPSPLVQPLVKGHERIRSFENLYVRHQPSPTSSGFSNSRGSKIPLTEKSPLNPLSSRASAAEPSWCRNRPRRPSMSAVQLSDEDADDESDNDTDDEYMPSSRPIQPKRRRITSQVLPRHSTSPKRSTSIPLIPVKRLSGTSLSRNRQATSVTAIARACVGTSLNFTCPECGWKQANKRLPDFKRHLRTHTRPDETDQSKGWWCKGVSVEEAYKFSIPDDAKSYVFLGQERIGGCMQTFSRRDALKRHLDNANVVCIGRPSEASDE